MDVMLLILIIVAVIIVILGILAIFFIKSKEGKHKVDYYSLFVMGLVWLIFGLILSNSILTIFGIAFFVIGLVKKDKWKKNRMDWSKINKRQKKILYIAMIMLFLLFVAGIIVFWLTKAGLL